jgi:glucan 1,3-beta-glucosidase
MQHTIHILRILLMKLSEFSRSFNPPLCNIVGIELLNEPAPGPQRKLLEKWYTDAIRALHSIDPTIPLYIGDCWQTDDFASYIQNISSNIILDHHLYRCFTSEDHAVSAYDHAGRLWDHNGSTPQMFARVAEKLESAGGGLVIGEWSGALNPKSLDGLNNEHHARSQFIQAQVDLYERHCAGYFFWTYKKQWGGDKGWSFRDAVEGGVFPTSIGLTVKKPVADHEGTRATRRETAKDKALGVCKLLLQQGLCM